MSPFLGPKRQGMRDSQNLAKRVIGSCFEKRRNLLKEAAMLEIELTGGHQNNMRLILLATSS